MLLMDFSAVMQLALCHSTHGVDNFIATDLPSYLYQAVVFKITMVCHLDSGMSIGTLAAKGGG